MSRPAWPGIVADVERSATPRGRRSTGCFVLEGTRLHERATRAGAVVERAIATSAYLEDRTPRIRAVLEALAAAGTEVHDAPRGAIERLTGGRDLGSIVGLARLPAEPDLAAVVGAAPRPAVIVVTLGVDDPGNLGALVRTAAALSAAAVVVAAPGDPYHPKAVRTSMGSLFRVPVFRGRDVSGTLALLDGVGATRVATVSRGGSPPGDAKVDGDPVAVLLGSEAFGLPDRIVESASVRWTVPMRDGIDSLSVNAAAAVTLYALRERTPH